MLNYKVPQKEWGDCIKWYHTKQSQLVSIRKEYPTTLEEILAIGENKTVFSPASIASQNKNIFPDKQYRLVTDAITSRPELRPDEEGPISVYSPPQQGRRYMLTCDPIASVSEDSDYYAASVFDMDKNEQVASLYVRGLPVEDLADLTEGLARIYNRALICPEANLAQALVACIRSKGYYHFYYPNKLAKSKKEPGFRTTVTTKPVMIDKLQLMLEKGSIVIHSKEALRQLSRYEKRYRSSGSVYFSAPKGDHDDQIIPLMLYAYSKTDRELMGKTRQSFAIL